MFETVEINNRLLRRIKTSWVPLVLALYLLGALIYGSWFGYFSNYLVLEPFKIQYLAAGLWWCLFTGVALDQIHKGTTHVVPLRLPGRFGGWLRTFETNFRLIAFPLLSILGIVFLVHILRNPMLVLSLVDHVVTLRGYVFASWAEQFFLKASFFFLLYFITLFLLYRVLYDVLSKRRLAISMLIVFVVNVAAFSHSIYPRIPRSIGGGELDHVSVVWEKGYIPQELEWIKKHPYRAFLVDEDNSNYYIAFRHPWLETTTGRPFSKQVFAVNKDHVVAIMIH